MNVCFSVDADLLQKLISTQQTKQSSKFQSDPCSDCFTIDVWKIKWSFYFLAFLLLLVTYFAQCSVWMTCDIIIGNRFVIIQVGAMFVQVWGWTNHIKFF